MTKKLISFTALFCFILCLASFNPRIVKAAEASSTHKGWEQDDSGLWYYYDTNGKKVQGWKTINKNRYYFDKNKGCAMVTGFRKIDGVTYYFMDKAYKAYSDSKEGRMMTGFKTINGYKYYFVDSQYPYSKQTGRMLTGFKTIGGKKYYFVDSKYPYSKITGRMLTGRKTIGGKGYLFNKYGVMQTGWVKYSGKWLFYNSKGINVVPVVVLDPGHSSDQPGTMVPIGPGADELKEADSLGTRGIVTRVYEYQFTFNIAKKLKTQLEARGYKVILTRNSNKGVYTCIDRAEVANKNKADAFIRIHANGSSNRSRTGAMTICITKENPYIPGMYKSSKVLSEVLLSNYLAAVGSIKSEGIWETDTMTGNNWSKVPTTLVEMGYMTNAQEDKKMQDAAFQKKIVKGLADGIEAYFHKAW